MTGRFGMRTGVVNHGGTNADLRLQGARRSFRDGTNENMPWIMRGVRGDQHAASISTFPERHSAWWFNSGFKETHNVGGGGEESGEVVTPVAQRWLQTNARSDGWFLHVHYWDPHTVYRAPAAFGEPFADAPPPSWITAEVLARHQAQCGPHTPYEINMYDGKPLPRFPRHVPAIRDLADLKKHFDGYDTGIRYADAQVGLLLAELATAGVLDDTMIIISSDHGENQGELGIYAEHGTADAATCRVPMIIRMPGGARGVVDRELRYQFDLLPTLMQINDREPPSGWDGRGYGDLLRRPIIRVLGLLRFLPTCYYGAVTVLIPLLISRLAGNKTAVALYATVSQVMAALTQLASGWAADRFGRRMPTLLSFGMLVAGSLGLAVFAHHLWAYFVFGTLGTSAAWSLSALIPCLVSDATPAAEHSRVLGLLMLVWNASMIVGSLLGGSLVTIAVGLPFLLVGVLNVVAVFLTLLFFRMQRTA